MTAKKYFFNTMMPALYYGALTGIITGVVIWGYMYLTEHILSLSQDMYVFVKDNLAFLPLLIAVLVGGGLINYFNTKITPEVKGGGVPYIEGAARGMLPLKWYKVLPSAIIGSFSSFICGLPLGSEGPSVLIGGAIGSGVNSISGKYYNKHNAWSRISITAGASAGFAVALSAPLAGILFALEECHKKFSPVVLLTSVLSVLFAAITAGLLKLATGIGVHTLFSFGITDISITAFYLPLIAGIAVGLAACGFSVLLAKSKKLVKKIKMPRWLKVVIAFVLSGVSCLFFIDLIGGGAGLINKIGHMQIEWQIILVLLVIKLVLILLCSSAQVSGGMFIPFMCIGALVGGLLAKLMVVCGMSEAYYSTIVVISMCAFLGAVLKAPITAIVLVVELIGGVSSLLAGLIAIVAAYLVTELFHIKPVYDEMLEDIMSGLSEGKEVKAVKVELKVKDGAYAVGKVIRDILLPSSVISIIHKEATDGNPDPELYRRGERVIMGGDTIIVEARTSDEKTLSEDLNDLFGIDDAPAM